MAYNPEKPKVHCGNYGIAYGYGLKKTVTVKGGNYNEN
jgi:hypothetical protein